ncbi:DUF503 domain-containing protein [Bacillus solimangrovi]|uniref:DUF503 domain-containing protein n=1 Tax=Bacillus solimangrovi TaxID=1305675 RepID=A0A1E5LE03_9BACI|nr:DUF503 domain-containing protein [Bacillus solimangrovi]OEH92317.1 hypothetical protein BFG57_16530 [Bacillus solimangrovi]
MIGVVRCECIIYDAQSLKDKRSITKRVIERIRNRFNVSIAETDHHQVWQRTEFTVAVAAREQVTAEKELNRVMEFIDSFPEIERTVTSYEWL